MSGWTRTWTAVAACLVAVTAQAQSGQAIQLSEEARQNLRIELAAAGVQDIHEILQIRGLLREQKDRTALVTPPTRGRVSEVLVKTAEEVWKGQVMLILHCPELEKLRTELVQGTERADLLEAGVERVRALVEDGVLAERDLLRAEMEHRLSRSATEAARRGILLLGMTGEELQTLLDHPERPAYLPVHAPIEGSVTRREAYVGEMVDPTRRLFQIMDTSVLWAEGDVFERDVPKVATGQEASLVLRPFREWRATGRIKSISANLDASKRTAHLWIEVKNPDLRLKPEMAVDISILLDTKAKVLAIPKEALLEEHGESFVFVANGDAFLRQAVVTGKRDHRFVEIADGLYEGDEVVVRGNHELRLALSGEGAPLGSDGHLHGH